MQHSLVTGASRGIGRAIAVALSRRGDRVAVHYGSDRDAAAETLSQLHGEGHLLVEGDLSDPAVATRVVEEAVSGLGRIDVLVNNAAIAPNAETSHPIATTDFDAWHRVWERMVAVDLLAPANVSFLVARSMIDRGIEGAIVNVGSRGAFRGEPEFPAYGAAKAGLHAMGNRSRSRSLPTASRSPRSRRVSSAPTGSRRSSRARAATASGRRALSAASRSRKRWRMPWSTSARRTRSGRRGRSST